VEEIFSQYGTFIFIAGFIVLLYFMMIRPQRKRQQQQQQLMDALAEGDRVMLTSGIYGTIRHLGDKQVIIEISPGVDLTVLRRAIVRPVKADEEEFEYADSEPSDPEREPESDVDWTLAELDETATDTDTETEPAGDEPDDDAKN
jgi:preprotein translocase subunit YajC